MHTASGIVTNVNVCHHDGVARFLFIVVPVVARVWPAVAIGDALAAMGHEVAWCGPEDDLRPVVGPQMPIYPTGKRSYREFHEVGVAAVRELWDEYLIPLNRFIKAPVESAVSDFQPDVVFADQYALVGAAAADKRGIRWATLAAGVLELTPPEGAQDLRELVSSRLAKLLHGNEDLLFSPDLVIATTSRALTGTVPIPQQCVLIGAALGQRRTDTEFPWDWWDSGRQHVLVTAGTLSSHLAQDFLNRMMVALNSMGPTVQMVINAPVDAVPDAPPHVLVAPRVPMLDLMPRLDAVICTGGQSTVNEALFHGVPLIVAPIRLGELSVARQVTRAGAGIEVSHSRATPAQLADALAAVLDEPHYRSRTREISEDYLKAGGTQAAAEHLAALATRR